MINKQDTTKLLEISSNILEIIDDQVSEYQREDVDSDGVDRSMTRGDLQGVIEAQVMSAYYLGVEHQDVIS